MRLPFMTNGDIVILVRFFFFAVLSRMWSVASQSTCQNRIKVFTVSLWYLLRSWWLFREKWDHTMVFRIQIKPSYDLLLFKYAYSIIAWSIIHDSFFKKGITHDSLKKKSKTFVWRFSFVMCSVSQKEPWITVLVNSKRERKRFCDE